MNNEEVKKFYNTIIKAEYAGTYEYKRWFSTKEKIAGYKSTKDTLLLVQKKHNLIYKKYLELGPGPGTWSEVFLGFNKDALMDLVDISEEMLRMTRKRFKSQTNINCIQSDFLLYDTDKKYDLFFSSRALEYFVDKLSLVKKIHDVLDKNGVGVVVTKMPHYKRGKMLRGLTSIHQHQIAPEELTTLISRNGFEVLGVYGTTYIFPLLRSGFLDRLLYKLFSKFSVNFFTGFFLESYTVVFKKV